MRIRHDDPKAPSGDPSLIPPQCSYGMPLAHPRELRTINYRLPFMPAGLTPETLGRRAADVPGGADAGRRLWPDGTMLGKLPTEAKNVTQYKGLPSGRGDSWSWSMARTPSSQCSPDSDGRTLAAFAMAPGPATESLVQQRATCGGLLMSYTVVPEHHRQQPGYRRRDQRKPKLVMTTPAGGGATMSEGLSPIYLEGHPGLQPARSPV